MKPTTCHPSYPHSVGKFHRRGYGLHILGFFAFGMLSILSAWAGGPLVVNNGIPVVWPDNKLSFVYTLDQGTLGNLSNYQATNLFSSAFGVWNKVTTSNLRFTRSTTNLPVDVTVSNYVQTLNNLPDGTNPIIFDNDGEIIDSMLGNNSKKYILGFASVYTSGNKIVMARAFFNGYYIKQEKQTENDVFSTLLHEIGHMAGLDHSQFSREIAYNNIASDDIAVPVMFPNAIVGLDTRRALTLDDQVAIANLYPTTYHRNSTGSITGTVKRSNKELPGVNIIARDRTNPIERSFSTVTGTYAPEKGSYELKGLPPGEYEIMVEAIDSAFTGTSSVGQYADTSTSQSFKQPVKAEYYNENDLTSEGRSTATFVNVAQYRTVTGIDVNVETQSQPTDEQTLRLLAIGSFTTGSIANSTTAPRYLLEPEGDEKSLTLTVTFNTATNYRVRVSQEISSGNFTTHTLSRTETEASFLLGTGGDIPLKSTRYIIEIASFSTPDRTFTVSVTQNQTIPTPTFTPTSTPTLTPTPTMTLKPTSTPNPIATPTYTPTPTPTPTAKPERTPTPMPLDGDVNRDGQINILDAYSFAQDWQKSATVVTFRSNLAPTQSLIIDHYDLMALVETLKKAN